MKSETQNVIERYERRKEKSVVDNNSKNFYFNHFAQSERELKYIEIIKSRYDSLDSLKILEIGAGTGINLFLFKKLGLKNENIYANELLSDRYKLLNDLFPEINTLKGDACEIDENLNSSFDIVFQSTVFTSILDYDFKVKLANKMWQLLKPGGIILWYDFIFDNPQNNDVKGVKKNEIIKLFKNHKRIQFYKTTLAPPIGRRVRKFYPLFNIFPFLRTHIIGVIEK